MVGGKEHVGKGNILNKIKKNVSRLLEGYKEKKKKGKETTKTLYDKLKSFIDSSLILATDTYSFQNKGFEEV